MWHQEAQEVAGAVQGVPGDTGHLRWLVTTSHLSSVWLPWPFICPRELSDPCYDNIIPLHLSWLLAWQRSQEQVQWSSCSLVFKPHSRNPTENKQSINVLTSFQWTKSWGIIDIDTERKNGYGYNWRNVNVNFAIEHVVLSPSDK